MSYYSIALYLHIVGVLGFFVALGLEWTSLWQVRGAKTREQVRVWMRITDFIRRLGMTSMLTLLAAGIYMAATAWGGVAWIIVALVATGILILLVMVLTRPRMAAIGRALATEKGPVSLTLQNLTRNSLLWTTMRIRVAIALGIVFLMTVKPDLVGSLLTIGVAIVLGLVSTLPLMLRRERVQEGPAD